MKSYILGLVSIICMFLVPGVVGSGHYIIGAILLLVLYLTAFMAIRVDKKGKR